MTKENLSCPICHNQKILSLSSIGTCARYLCGKCGHEWALPPEKPYVSRRETLITYLRMKVDIEDWHGVADAANDLRELDAEERGRNGS